MENKQIAILLKNALKRSQHPDQWDDNITPSKRRKYDGEVLGQNIEALIDFLMESRTAPNTTQPQPETSQCPPVVCMDENDLYRPRNQNRLWW